MQGTGETKGQRARSAKKPLSHDVVIHTAIGLLEGNDPDNVSLRDIASVLETGPASLYAYVKSRDDLMLQALDAVLATVQLPPSARVSNWKKGLADSIQATIETLRPYPGLSRIGFGTLPVLPGSRKIVEFQTKLMVDAGISDEDTALACDLIATYVSSTSVHAPGKDGHGTHIPSYDRKVALNGVQKTAELVEPVRSPFDNVTRLILSAEPQAKEAYAISILIEGIAARIAE